MINELHFAVMIKTFCHVLSVFWEITLKFTIHWTEKWVWEQIILYLSAKKGFSILDISDIDFINYCITCMFLVPSIMLFCEISSIKVPKNTEKYPILHHQHKTLQNSYNVHVYRSLRYVKNSLLSITSKTCKTNTVNS